MDLRTPLWLGTAMVFLTPCGQERADSRKASFEPHPSAQGDSGQAFREPRATEPAPTTGDRRASGAVVDDSSCKGRRYKVGAELLRDAAHLPPGRFHDGAYTNAEEKRVFEMSAEEKRVSVMTGYLAACSMERLRECLALEGFAQVPVRYTVLRGGGLRVELVGECPAPGQRCACVLALLQRFDLRGMPAYAEDLVGVHLTTRLRVPGLNDQ